PAISTAASANRARRRRSFSARTTASTAAAAPSHDRAQATCRVSRLRPVSSGNSPARTLIAASRTSSGDAAAATTSACARPTPLPPLSAMASASRRRQTIVLQPLAHDLLVDLARGAQRDVVDEDHVVGHPPLGDLALQEV